MFDESSLKVSEVFIIFKGYMLYVNELYLFMYIKFVIIIIVFVMLLLIYVLFV